MNDEERVAHRLADELTAIGNARGPLTFAATPFDAYTLVAVLQAASRHPELSDVQRRIVVGLAHQLAAELASSARGLIGLGSAVETTLGQGFDPSHDVPRSGG